VGPVYFAALGLGLGRALNIAPDAAVRLPFVAAHAATADVVSMGLSTFAGVRWPVAVGAGAAVSLPPDAVFSMASAVYRLAEWRVAVLAEL
jgi:hypothetical protein